MNMTRTLAASAALLICVSASTVRAGDEHEHGDDVVVGRTSANQLAYEFDAFEVFVLPAISNPPLFGWGNDDPGFLSLDEDEPDEDFFTLAPDANIRFVVDSIDPALKGWFDAFSMTFDEPTEFFPLGSPDFDEHPFWHIDSAEVGFDPLQTLWTATGRLVDVGTTGYTPSDPITFQFSNIPEPATIGLLLAGGAVLTIRRRRASLRHTH